MVDLFNNPKPFVKWVGGKRQLLGVLRENMPSDYNRYYEPFVGAGAMLFDLQPKKAFIGDMNPELMNTYKVIKNTPDELIESLKKHKNESDYFYKIRAIQPSELSELERASRFIFLNKTCFNGLYRENSKGFFNSPFGSYKNPRIVDEENIANVSAFLKKNKISIEHRSYEKTVRSAKEGDLVFFDPPYIPLTPTANFSSYTKNGFRLKQHKNLSKLFARLSKRGIYVMQTNSNTDIVRNLYKDFNIKTLHATRMISCKSDGRGAAANEVLITNY